MPTDLELSIFRTLCWFSIFNYPLTTFEIWKWLLRPVRPYDLFEVTQILSHSSWLSDRIIEQDGFWTLPRAKHVSAVKERHERFLNAIVKYKKLHSACYFFQLISGVRAVASVNTLAWWHTTKESDIDVFIVTSPNMIWSTRFFLVLPFVLIGNRPARMENVEVSDPFCFSFFATSEALQLEELKLNSEDFYLAFWIKSLVPMFDRSDVFSQLASLNRWADVILPNAKPRISHPVHRTRRIFSNPIQLSFLEPFLRSIQKKRFPPRIVALANQDSRVVISDQILKFHDQDRRAQFIREFNQIYEREMG
ncbi:hypothetical protein HY771_01225 [Candidatus Uhrbacteria bacterium]|nr:hypothetical protein [Candidatus Uhrbacteria bacterium]